MCRAHPCNSKTCKSTSKQNIHYVVKFTLHPVSFRYFQRCKGKKKDSTLSISLKCRLCYLIQIWIQPCAASCVTHPLFLKSSLVIQISMSPQNPPSPHTYLPFCSSLPNPGASSPSASSEFLSLYTKVSESPFLSTRHPTLHRYSRLVCYWPLIIAAFQTPYSPTNFTLKEM